MKVFWVENKEGQYYGSVRYFTDNGPPKLYGSEKKLRTSLAAGKSWGGDGWTLPDHMVVCSGRLLKDD